MLQIRIRPKPDPGAPLLASVLGERGNGPKDNACTETRGTLRSGTEPGACSLHVPAWAPDAGDA